MPFTQSSHVDQTLVEDMISIFQRMPRRQRVVQTLATHTVLHQATAMATVIPKHYWLAVIAFILLKLKFIISLKFYVRSCILLICNLRYFQVPLSYLTCI